ncbi:ATP-binding protein [Affinibrenneria salicis]|nr:ATP-binding protein [Affinibrenneria salicis]
MRGRLFWKILLGFWVTFIVIAQLLWLAFSLYGERPESPEHNALRHIVNLQMGMAEQALRQGGLPAYHAMVERWPASEREYITVNLSGELPLNNDDMSWEKLFDQLPEDDTYRQLDALLPDWASDEQDLISELEVNGPHGENFTVRYDIETLRDELHPNMRGKILNIPEPMLWLGGLGGLLFSALLAWNLTRPLNQLRAGFERVAQGDLSVRLLPKMRRRHDELSEVAQDFDSMAARLEVLVSTREQLLHDVSHELRSPLARLQLAIGLAHQNPENVAASLLRIERESSRMDKMIGELLALSRTENSLEEEEYFDLLGLVTAVVNDARYEAQLPGIEIKLLTSEDPDEDYTVKGRAELIRRAVDNIVRNALRFSSRDQVVSVRLSGDEQLWTISVCDSGPGVENSKLSSIFDPFVRIESPLSGKGYGLGLAIARKVMQAHGGYIEASNREHGGLEVRLCLPRWQLTEGNK